MRTRPRGISSILYLSILSVIILAGCSGLTDLLGIENGKDGAAGAAGATGATGAEGPSVYIVTSTGERIYSGGVFFPATGVNAFSETFTIVNKTGHSLALEGTPALVESVGGWYELPSGPYNVTTSPIGDADGSGLSPTIAPDAVSGNSFSITYPVSTGQKALYWQSYRIALKDLTTNEAFSITFAIQAVLYVYFPA